MLYYDSAPFVIYTFLLYLWCTKDGVLEAVCQGTSNKGVYFCRDLLNSNRMDEMLVCFLLVPCASNSEQCPP